MPLVNKKSTVAFTIGVVKSNPNGNTDNGEPRMTRDERGFLSPMCIKAHLRLLIENPNSPVAMELMDGLGIKPENYSIFESLGRGILGAENANDSFNQAIALLKRSEIEALNKWFDLRCFGGTILEENQKKKAAKAAKEAAKSGKKGATAVAEADDDGNAETVLPPKRFTQRGVVQVLMPQSIKPVELVIGGVTRKASTQTKDHENLEKSNGMIGQGAIRVVNHGIYYGAIFISPSDAAKTGTTDSDIDLLKKMIPHMFYYKSAQRAGVEILSAYCLDHPNALGVIPDRIFLDAARPKLRDETRPYEPSNSNDEYIFPTLAEVQEVVRGYSRHSQNARVSDLMA